MTVYDLFGGPGGWDEGLRLIGYDGPVVGVELDDAACATRAAAGHATIRQDVASVALDESWGELEGLIASPPCTALSRAGKREGVAYLPQLVAAIRRRDWAFRPAGLPSDARR